MNSGNSWVSFIIFFSQKLNISKLKNKNNENLKNMLWPSLQINIFLYAIQLCSGQAAGVITVNSTIASERWRKSCFQP